MIPRGQALVSTLKIGNRVQHAYARLRWLFAAVVVAADMACQ
jgi:hypothetical protein